MTIEECYTKFGGNYSGVLGRLGIEALIKRILAKIINDERYANN